MKTKNIIMKMRNNYLKLIRFVLIIAAIFLFLVLILKDLAWTGNLQFKTNFKRFTPFISILVPEERVEILNLVYINQEPVYFDLYMPRDFAKVELEFAYKNFSNNIIEVGAQIGEYGWKLKPLDNRIINNLDWPRLEENGLILFQREKKFESINQFLNNLPPLQEVAAYDYELDYDFKIDDYQATDEILKLDKVIYGGYEFYTYICDEELYFEFNLNDDEVEINQENTHLYVYDKKSNELAVFSPENNKITARLENLPEGDYKVALSTDDYAITKSIQTKQQYLSFVNSLDLVSPASLITESNNLTFMATENEGVQTIKINDEKVEIKEIWQQYNSEQESGLKKINIPNGNLQITGEGLLAFSQEQYFNPLFKLLTQTTDLDKEKINYLITKYSLPLIEDDFKINNVEFDLFDKQINNGKLRFIISVPGLGSSAQGVLIENLKVNLLRPPVWQDGLMLNLKNYLKYYKNEIQ